ncbi:MAG: hypothetical protein PHF12_03855 [Candidatus Omnitrophica bacterium]|nr:hypothetical protein [Candidatus Omnitrophota bacterium]
MSTADMTKTQEIPIPESVGDIWRNDPLKLFSYRQETRCIVCGVKVSGDVYCSECLALEVAQAEECPPIYIAEGMEDEE